MPISSAADRGYHEKNLIREYTYFDYYINRSLTFTDPPELLRIHVGQSHVILAPATLLMVVPLDHCIEMLRQKLMCDADVGVITHSWVSRRETPWPDFNVRHNCRNFEGVVEWSEKHNAPKRETRRPSNIAGLDPPP